MSGFRGLGESRLAHMQSPDIQSCEAAFLIGVWSWVVVTWRELTPGVVRVAEFTFGPVDISYGFQQGIEELLQLDRLKNDP
jgi:hypothetical protein